MAKKGAKALLGSVIVTRLEARGPQRETELVSFPRVSYMICSVRDHKLESYIWADGRFVNERITISKRKTRSGRQLAI